MKKYITRDREAGNVIDEFLTRDEAEKAIEQYEETDREDETYTPDFYEVAEIDDGLPPTTYAEIVQHIKNEGETPENLALLGEWFWRGGIMFWTGECYVTEKEFEGRNLYPISEPDADDPEQYNIVGYELR